MSEPKNETVQVRIASSNIINSDYLRVYTPSNAVEGDLEFFRTHKGRRMFIRQQGRNEFECGVDMSFNMHLNEVATTMPALWVLVIGDDSLYFSVPVYRGKAFFQIERGSNIADVKSDQATVMLVAEMFGRGGGDKDEFAQWKAKWQQAIAEHNIKTLNPDGKVN